MVAKLPTIAMTRGHSIGCLNCSMHEETYEFYTCPAILDNSLDSNPIDDRLSNRCGLNIEGLYSDLNSVDYYLVDSVP